jgi:hypothetical protein
VALSGQSARDFLHETDPFVRNTMLKVAERHQQLTDQMHENLAGHIIKKLAEATKK